MCPVSGRETSSCGSGGVIGIIRSIAGAAINQDSQDIETNVIFWLCGFASGNFDAFVLLWNISKRKYNNTVCFYENPASSETL